MVVSRSNEKRDVMLKTNKGTKLHRERFLDADETITSLSYGYYGVNVNPNVKISVANLITGLLYKIQ